MACKLIKSNNGKPMAQAGKRKKATSKALASSSSPLHHPYDPAKVGVEYWRQLCPWLHVADQKYQKTFLESLEKENAENMSSVDDGAKARFRQEGYTTLTTVGKHLAESLARAAVRLQECGWPASFMIIYDEAFALSACVDKQMLALTGKNANNGDMLAWFIDPNKNEAGFSPHRDRQPENPPASFSTDAKTGEKIPLYSTAWVALTNATPENSCLYVVPAQHDPGYFSGDLDTVDPLQRCFPDKTGYQNIRAVPVSAGDSVCFSHRILHWGSRGRLGYHTPRIALSVACAADQFEPCYFDRKLLPFPQSELRLGLVCGQMVCYHERFNCSGKAMHFFASVFRKSSHLFSMYYQKKVLKDLIPAIEEASKRDEVSGTPSTETPANVAKVSSSATFNWHSQSNEEDDDIDDALMQMLDAASAMGEDGDLAFHDDFDDAGEGIQSNQTESNEPLRKKARH